MNHYAIRRAYPNAVTVDDDTGAFDRDGNQIELDQALVDAAVAELVIENAWNELRTKRNQLLAETDYLALSDRAMTAEMTAYRQALRDLPANTTDPANPVFPTKPGA